MGDPYSTWNGVTLVSVHILLSLIFFAAAVSLLVFIVRKPMRRHKPFDMAIFKRLQPWVSPANDRFMLFITLLGKHQFLIPANLILILFFLFIPDRSWFAIRVAAIAISSLILMLLLKNLFRRKRPLAPLLKAARGLSFPSGHAIMAVTFFGLIIFIIFQAVENEVLAAMLAGFFVVLILLIGFSRVYLRVHYASDVLAGFIIGLIWLMISLAALNKLEQYSKNRPGDLKKLPSSAAVPDFTIYPGAYTSTGSGIMKPRANAIIAMMSPYMNML
jgi:membrane-associated phospholipid phosphatase